MDMNIMKLYSGISQDFLRSDIALTVGGFSSEFPNFIEKLPSNATGN